MTRLWPAGQQIQVILPAHSEQTKEAAALFARAGPEIEKIPKEFTWQGRNHRVVEITRYWRVDIDWWRDRIWRAYYKLRTDTGLLVVIYQDLLEGGWYLQRLYD